MLGDKIVVLVAMLLYMALIVVVGVVFFFRTKNSSDYYLGGRGLNPWICAMSAEASDMSGWLLMGLPGVAYFLGIGEAFWTAIGLGLGTYLNWKLIATRLRNYTAKAGDAITLPDFFSNRFRDNKKVLMSIAAIFILIFFTIYTATGFVACGKLFNTIFGIDYRLMMLISAVIIVTYTAVGGFLAESTTDFIQGILMFFSLIIVLVAATAAVGGIGAISDKLSSMGGFLNVMGITDPATRAFKPYDLIGILSNLGWGLGYFGMPHILLRFMAIRSVGELKRSRSIAMTWVIISMAAAVFIGIVGRAFLGDVLAESGALSETVFIQLSLKLLPTFFAGIVLSGILAATMSTADSQLLVTSSAVSSNFYKGILRKNATEKEIVWVGRATVILVAIVACLMALNPASTIFNLVKYAWGGFGATFGPLIIFSLFWKRMTRTGALVGMLGGGITIIVWREFISKLGGVFAVYELIPAFLLSTILIVVVSLLGKEPPKEVTEEFEQVAAMK